MFNPLTRTEFDHQMKRNDFVIDSGEVVCKLCRSDCGQCGAGGHMGRCQEYYDTHPTEFSLVAKLKAIPLPSPMVILMSLSAIVHAFVQ